MNEETKLPDSDGVSEYDRLFARLLVVSKLADEDAINTALGELKANPTKRLSDVLVEHSVISTEIKNAIEALTSGSQAIQESIASKNDFPETVSFAYATGDETTGFQGGDSDPLKKSFGDYEILEKIAKGGMGAVYKARHNRLNRIVALKTILDKRLDDEGAVKRFHAEAQAAAQLDHSGIVPVFQVGQVAGQHFYSMAFVEGESLNDRVKTIGPLEPKQAARFVMEAAEAVHYAHGKGVVHRDIKPHNILIDSENGKPRVTDFGLAKQVGADSELTATGQVMGTPSYMPPEQATGRHEEVGVTSDIYSLGASLYFLLTARPPFQAASTAETLRQVLDTSPVSPRALNASVPKDLETICLKCLSKETEARYSSAEDLADDLRRWLNDEPILARPVSRIEKAWKWCKRRPALVGTVAAAILVLAAVSVILVQLRNDAEATRIVNGLLQANTSQIQSIIKEDLPDYQRWAKDDLSEAFVESADDSNAKLHAALAMLPEDKSVLPTLKDRLLTVTPMQFQYVRDLLDDDKDELVDYYWQTAKKNKTPALRFQAACALAGFDSENEHWQDEEICTFVADHLVSVRPSELLPWTNALRPVKDHLIRPLSTIYRNPDASEQVRSFATDTLADYASEDAEGLFDLLADSSEQQFKVMFDALTAHQDRAIELGNSEVAQTFAKDSSEEDKEAMAMRQANAAVMLLRMDAPDHVWPLLKHSPDPRVRSYIIHWLSSREGDPQTIIARYEKETDVTIKRALLLCLGEFELADSDKQPLIEKLLEVYRNDPDAGLHAAAEWLLRRWIQVETLNAIDEELQQTEDKIVAAMDHQDRWYVNTQGQTFVIIDAGEFQMGSTEEEVGHNLTESLHRRNIGRRIAISSKEVTHEQWRAFSKANPKMRWRADQEEIKPYIRTDDSPITGMTWYEAAWYCNWLSEEEGIPQEQWCYEKNENGEYGPGMGAKGNYLSVAGYRLPTESEWEYACRGGSSTARYYGSTVSLLASYAWYFANSGNYAHPVASLKPNELGLFDMLGNAEEWCDDEVGMYPDAGEGVVINTRWANPNLDSSRRVLRGGAFTARPAEVRSADRANDRLSTRGHIIGFRPARTTPR